MYLYKATYVNNYNANSTTKHVFAKDATEALQFVRAYVSKNSYITSYYRVLNLEEVVEVEIYFKNGVAESKRKKKK